MRRPSHIFRLACIAAVLLAAGVPPAGSAEEGERAPDEKAAYLYKLAPFVEWPESAFSKPDSPFYICVVGDEAFGRRVARAAAGQRLETHEFVVRSVPAVGPDSGCHIVYVGGDPALAAETVRALHGQPVLTVTDAAGGGPARGVVHFITHEGRVRFEIDVRMAEQQGLSISSRLLELALRVRR